MSPFGVGALQARQKFEDDGLNFEPAIASQGAVRAVGAAVHRAAMAVGDTVRISAPAGLWEWMNGRVLTVRRFVGEMVWCDEWAEDAGAFVLREFLVPVDLLERISK